MSSLTSKLCTIYLLFLVFIVSEAVLTKVKLSLDTPIKETRPVFDGIGAISGGGATSKLLRSYPTKYRDAILDLLFKPGYLGALQILKVEIGGDSQSTDGTEASHMHSKYDLNFNRGYEWWLMKEAKKRNPSIILCGLPWVFPGWLGEGTQNPYAKNSSNIVTYILNWVHGARQVHGLKIDYIGIWNERSWNVDYIKLLRKSLDMFGYVDTRIIAADGGLNGIENEVVKDPSLASAIDVLGYHYPGAKTTVNAIKTKKRRWCSEEYSAKNDLKGGGCWARILTESFVDAGYTGFIAWNLITSYYDGLPYTRSSLMTANQPWSGWFDVASPIWITAHFTHFIDVGWLYLPVGNGSGHLSGGGSFTSLMSPDKNDLTIIIQTIDPHNAGCFYGMPIFNVTEKQSVLLSIPDSFSKHQVFHYWKSSFDYSGNSTSLFVKQADLEVLNGTIRLEMTSNTIISLTTIEKSYQRPVPPVNPPRDFPRYYFDDFESYQLSQEPDYITAQAGTLEIQQSPTRHGKVMKQMVTEPPIDTCLPTRMPRPIALVGSINWQNVLLSVNVSLPSWTNSSTGLFVGTRLDTGGCNSQKANGLFLWLLLKDQKIILTTKSDMSSVIAQVSYSLLPDAWYAVTLITYEESGGTMLEATIARKSILKTVLPKNVSKAGWVTLGTQNFGVAFFDDLSIKVI